MSIHFYKVKKHCLITITPVFFFLFKPTFIPRVHLQIDDHIIFTFVLICTTSALRQLYFYIFRNSQLVSNYKNSNKPFHLFIYSYIYLFAYLFIYLFIFNVIIYLFICSFVSENTVDIIICNCCRHVDYCKYVVEGGL